MSVLGRVLFSSAERVDLTDLISIDSYAAGDWKYFLRSLVGSRPYILTGFDIIDPESAINTESCSIRVADSIVYYPTSSAGPFYHGLPSGNAYSTPLVPELRKNATNYVYLTLSTFNTSTDTRSFWDPDRDGGVGAEYTQDVDTESVIKAEINVSTGSFPTGTVPIAIITVGPTNITSIQDARDLLFRLGTGGINPSPYSEYNFRSLPSVDYSRSETPTIMTGPSDPNPFQGADKNILTLKEWMDAVMTKLKELGGTTYWYENTSSFNISNIFNDALSTSFKSKGQYLHDSSTPGQLTWTEDLVIKNMSSPRDVIVRAGDITIANEQVAYLNLVRSQPINSLDQAVAWINGQNYINTVNGSVGFFSNLSKGDWIKKTADGAHLFLRVLEFYSQINLGGSTTTAANARSVQLSGAYLGTTAVDRARYDKGIYLDSDVLIQDRSNAGISVAGGDFTWLAQRSDTIQNIASVAVTTVDGDITTANGKTAKIVSASSHGLVTGDRIQVTAPAAQAGIYRVEVDSTNAFYIDTTNTTTGTFEGHYAVLETAARNVAAGLPVESANHNFETNQTIIIAGTTNFNGSVNINVRSATEIQFAVDAAYATETTGTATLARIDARSESGITKIIQGEILNIGEGDSENIQRFIGMSALNQEHPDYSIPADYSTLTDKENYNSSTSDNLAVRVGKLTAMTADKAQDKNIKFLTDAISAINTQNGSAQELTFVPSGRTLTLLQPGSPYNATVSLSSLISLEINQSAYVTIDRNDASAPVITVADNSEVPVDENSFVIASRLSDQIVYLWNGLAVLGSTPIAGSGTGLVKVALHDVVSTTLPIGDPVIVDDAAVNAGDLVLFSNLSIGANRIYEANGTGTNISSWTAQYSFGGAVDPTDGDTVIVTGGDSFAEEIGKFNGSDWIFNDKVRYFNADKYWEQGNINDVELLNNTTDDVFSVPVTGNEHMVLNFSVSRDNGAAVKYMETGTMHIVSDGIDVSVASQGAQLNGFHGIQFSGDIDAGQIRLRYTSSNLGTNAKMRYIKSRWPAAI